jgi:hypothetical protein
MSDFEYTAVAMGEVKIRVSANAPDDLFTRMASGDLPASLYGVMDRVRVFEHWTYNAIRNGVTDVSQLDGWADMDRGLVTLDVTDVDDFTLETARATS